MKNPEIFNQLYRDRDIRPKPGDRILLPEELKKLVGSKFFVSRVGIVVSDDGYLLILGQKYTKFTLRF